MMMPSKRSLSIDPFYSLLPGLRTGRCPGGPDLGNQHRHEFIQVTDHSEVGDLEYRRAGILVDGNDDPGLLHSMQVLDRAGDAAGDVELRLDRIAGKAHLASAAEPARSEEHTS